MAIPTKKIYGRNGKLMFDPNNPEDVRNYKEKEPLIEALKLVQGLTDPRTGGGLTGATRIISRVTGAKMAKAKFTQNRANQILELFGKKPMTRGKKAVPKAAKKATPTIKEVVETKPTIPTTIPTSGSTASDKIKSLYDQLSSGKPKQSNILESVKNVRELAEKQVKNAPITPSTAPVKKGLTREEMKAYNQKTGNALQTAKDIVSKNLERVKELKKESETFYQKSIPESIAASNKKITDRAIGAGVIAGVIGGGAGTTYYGMQLSNKDNKQTTTPQKTGPVDLKRINPSKLKPSSIPGVSITKAMVNGKEKEFGIVWDNKTQSWDYYRSDKTIEPPKPDVVKKEDLGGGSGTNTGSRTGSGGKTTTGGGGTTTPVKPTVTPATTTYVGNEYAKANPDIEKAMQEDSIKQQRIMYTEKMSKPLSSIVFKTTSKAVDVRNTMDEQDALRSIREDNKLPLKKKRYGGNLAMLKYMK